MLWLDRPPYLRWTAAGLLAAVAFWSEFGPAPTTDAWIAVRDVAPGDALTHDLFVRRQVSWEDGPETIAPHGVAAVHITAGDPLLASMATSLMIPDGWMVLAAPLPPGSVPGAEATVVLLPAASDDGQTRSVPAVVAGEGSDDPFDDGVGTIAVPGERLPEVVAAAASDRLVVAVSALEE